MDETIAPAVYRTGRGDRAIPLTVAAGAAAASVASGLFSGPQFWPWGAAGVLLGACGCLAAFVRWRRGFLKVRWDEAAGVLELQQGRKVQRLEVQDLLSVKVRPASGFTELRTLRLRVRLPHRLVRVDRLIDRLRDRRPDLFAEPTDRLVLRVSAADLALLAGSVAATGAAGWLLAAWKPWVGVLFGLGAAAGTLQLLFAVPRGYEVTEGVLLTRSLLGTRRRRGAPTTIREDAYAAGGAVFFRMRLGYGRRSVVLDEGHLTGPLRPHAGWIVHTLAGRPR